jgi:hypothetical protein
VVEHMVGVHQSVRRYSSRFEHQLKRHNYVTVGLARGWEREFRQAARAARTRPVTPLP